MHYINKKDSCKLVLVGSLVILTFFLRSSLWSGGTSLVHLNKSLIYPLIYFGLFIAWGVSLKKRIINKQTLQFLMSIVGLMLLWFMFRTTKYHFIGQIANIARWLWYAYYIPLLLIPLMTIFMSLSLGKEEDYRLPAWTKAPYLLSTIILIILVFTNDLHQLVFTFPGARPWTSQDYKHGLIYWFIWAWIALIMMASIAITMIRSRQVHKKKHLHLPLIPYLMGLVYTAFYIEAMPFLEHLGLHDMTAVFCLIIMSLFESQIQVGLIRSNKYYEELFYNSDLNAKIYNKDFSLCYQTSPSPMTANDNTRISTFSIPGGQVYWQEDISEINRLLNQLREINQRLSEENNLLQAEVELREKKTIIEEKSRLYDRLTGSIEGQLQLVKEILSEETENTSFLEEKLENISILGTYIKRRSNLFLLKEEKETFSARELGYCLRESLEAISLKGVDCSLKASCKDKVKAKHVLLAYDLFEEIIETVLPSLTALFINLHISKGRIEMKLQISCKKEALEKAPIREEDLENTGKLLRKGGYMGITREDENLAIRIELPKAGDDL